jgi:hypothetical protein
MLLTTYISEISMQAHKFSTQLQTPEALSPSTSSTLIMHSQCSLLCTFLTLYISLFTMLLEVPPPSSSHTPVVLRSHVSWKSWSTVTQQAQNSYTTKRGFHAETWTHPIFLVKHYGGHIEALECGTECTTQQPLETTRLLPGDGIIFPGLSTCGCRDTNIVGVEIVLVERVYMSGIECICSSFWLKQIQCQKHQCTHTR